LMKALASKGKIGHSGVRLCIRWGRSRYALMD
jgi:hypothetical protein